LFKPLYSADPSAHVWPGDDRLWLSCSPDQPWTNTRDTMISYHLFSSSDLNGTDYGVVLHLRDVRRAISHMRAIDCSSGKAPASSAPGSVVPPAGPGSAGPNVSQDRIHKISQNDMTLHEMIWHSRLGRAMIHTVVIPEWLLPSPPLAGPTSPAPDNPPRLSKQLIYQHESGG